MKKLYYRTLAFFNVVESKIAFYPTILALFGIFFAFFMMSLENQGISKYLLKNFPILVVNNGNTALTILSSLISGLISVIVFSFSMVMLLLSQASNNYSPRLLPGLISDKTHQYILGLYLSTILYNIFILFSIQPTGDKYQIPGFSVLIGILGTVVCIYAFIYFIHNISQSIQINNILDRLFTQAQKRLNKLIGDEEKEYNHDFPSTDKWFTYKIQKSGYLQNISYQSLITICEEQDTRLHILPVKGAFVLKDSNFFKSEKELDQEIVKNVISNFNFARAELVTDNYVLAFKQITEVILKAMSPGINDPGTAINAIDYLTELFAIRLKKRDDNIFFHDKQAVIKVNIVRFKDLLYNIMASIRTYCKHDIILTQRLLVMFNYMKTQVPEDYSYSESINNEAVYLINDAKKALSNPVDIETAMDLARKLDLDMTKIE